MKKRDEKWQEAAGGKQPRSASPSSLSTASSEAPLVRNASPRSSGKSLTFSIGSNSDAQSTSSVASSSAPGARRPAPTSIAAAQLEQQARQQQQQQQLDGGSGSKSRKQNNGNKLAHMMMGSKQQYDENCGQKELQLGGQQPLKANRKSCAGAKSVGYKFGKLVAQRANSFHEFWSANKMRYLNLACLLMTLVCLFTILLFSKTSPMQARKSPSSLSEHLSERRELPLVESLEALGKLAQTSQIADETTTTTRPTTTTDDEPTMDSLQVFDEPQQAAGSSKRDLSAAPVVNDEREREAEETSSAPELGDMLDELDGTGFGLMRALRAQLNASTRPIVRRTENGATIIFGGTMLANEASAGGARDFAQTIPTLLERMLFGGGGHAPARSSREKPAAGSFGATIRIQAQEPQVAGRLFNGDPFGATAESVANAVPQPLFFAHGGPPPMGFPPSLLGALLRAATSSSAAAASAAAAAEAPRAEQQAAKGHNNSTSASLDPLRQQASHTLSEQVAKVNATNAANNQQIINNQEQDEVDTFDVSSFARAPMQFASAGGPFASPFGSMLLLGSSGADPERRLAGRSFLFAGPHLTPLSKRPWPMFATPLDDGGPLPLAVSPFLRALLGARGPQEPKAAAAAARRDEPISTADEWDEIAAARSVRTRQLQAPSETRDHRGATTSETTPDELAGVESGATLIERMLGAGAGATGASVPAGSLTIRRTLIRRPGLAIERVIGVPRSIAHRISFGDEQPQQVGAGVRSQSLSRLDGGSGDQSDELAEQTASSSEPDGAAGLFGRLLGAHSSPFAAMMQQQQQQQQRRVDEPLMGTHSLFMGPALVPFGGAPLAGPTSARSARQMLLSETPADENNAEDNDDEPDEPHWSPRLRVARVRVHTSAPRQHQQAVAPRQPLNGPPLEQHEQLSQHQDAQRPASSKQHEQLEERLNQAISAAAAAAAAAASSAASNQQQQQQAADLTSPSSPLFGFPVSARAGGQSQSALHKEEPKRSKPFVYHSNNELAGQFAQPAGAHLQQARSAVAENDKPQQVAPPAAVVMGRRLDDGPLFADDEQAQQHQKQLSTQTAAAAAASFRAMGNARQLQRPISLAAPPNDQQQAEQPSQFKTIVV